MGTDPQAIALAVTAIVAAVGYWLVMDANPSPARHIRHEGRPTHRGAASLALAAALAGPVPRVRRAPLARPAVERLAWGRHRAVVDPSAPGARGVTTAADGRLIEYRLRNIVGDEREDLRARAAELYVDQDMSVRAVVAEVGCSYGVVRKLLEEAGVRMAPVGKRRNVMAREATA